jgi:protein TonB
VVKTKDEVKSPVKPSPATVSERVVQPEPPDPKKPVLGKVRLAAPTMKHAAGSPDNAIAAPSLGSESVVSNGEGMGSVLGSSSATQPAAPEAPIAVGGEVRPARMLTSVPPVYPTLAKSQHVYGDVKIDALIDANGRVTSMKVVSGPTLLHQAAMDSLRQWRYQPATLDGKAVPMHLTVTLQFRLQ